MVNTPVLFITFARPEYASQSFAAIKKAQPKKLYFYSNKARDDRPDEIKRNEEVRSYINQIDWDCELVTWFRDEYVDIYTSLWGAMDWLFDNEEEGIVLEEDCVANPLFFEYCEKMLEYYRTDDRITIISGNNRAPEYNPEGRSYFFTKFIDIYGWASWSKKWKEIDRSMKGWPLSIMSIYKYYNHWLPTFWYKFFWGRMYRILYKFNPWDCISCYDRIKNNTYGIIPSYNLVDDIGKYGVHHKIRPDEVNNDVLRLSVVPGDLTFGYYGDACVFDRYEILYFRKRMKKEIAYSLRRFFQKIMQSIRIA